MEKIRFCRIVLGLILPVCFVLSLCRCDSATRIAPDLESAVPAAFTSVEEPLPFTCQKIPQVVEPASFLMKDETLYLLGREKNPKTGNFTGCVVLVALSRDSDTAEILERIPGDGIFAQNLYEEGEVLYLALENLQNGKQSGTRLFVYNLRDKKMKELQPLPWRRQDAAMTLYREAFYRVDGFSLMRYDIKTGEEKEVFSGVMGNGENLPIEDGYLGLLDGEKNEILRFNAAENRLEDRIAVGSRVTEIQVSGKYAIWTEAGGERYLYQLDTQTLASLAEVSEWLSAVKEYEIFLKGDRLYAISENEIAVFDLAERTRQQMELRNGSWRAYRAGEKEGLVLLDDAAEVMYLF